MIVVELDDCVEALRSTGLKKYEIAKCFGLNSKQALHTILERGGCTVLINGKTATIIKEKYSMVLKANQRSAIINYEGE